MLDLAPGWIIRCPKCGKQKPLGETGAIRLGAASIGKRTLAWCSKCKSLRWAAIERNEPAFPTKFPDFEPIPPALT